MDGVLVLDKPSGITSRAAVDHVQGWFPRVKMGHAGTLDPLATGLLLICLGQARRLIEYAQRLEKTYEAVIHLGARSTTDDADGVITLVEDAAVPSREEVSAVLGRFVGVIQQTPPAHSAIKLAGRRAHVLARAGQEVKPATRPVEVHELEMLAYAYPELNLRIRCGKGTYVRSIARDLGEALKCGGFVAALRRTRIGAFDVRDALTWTATPVEARRHLLPIETLLQGLPEIQVDGDRAASLRHGRTVACDGQAGPEAHADVAVREAGGKLVCVARWDAVRRTLAPMKVLTAQTPWTAARTFPSESDR